MNSTCELFHFSQFNDIWNCAEPRIPQCIQETLLNALPAVMMIISVIYSYIVNDKMTEDKSEDTESITKEGKLEVTRFFQRFLIALCTAINMLHAFERLSSDSWNHIHLASGLICLTKSSLFVWILVLLWRNGVQRIHGLLWTASVFELLFALNGTYNALILASNDGKEEVVIYSIHLSASLVLFLTFYCDQESESINTCNKSGIKSRDESSFASRVFLWWFTLLIKYGYKKPLDFGDLPALNNDMNAKDMSNKFHEKVSQSSSKKMKLMSLMGQIFWRDLFIIIILQTICDCLSMMIPILIKVFIAFIESDFDEPAWHGYFFGVLMLACSSGSSLLTAQVGQISWSTKIRMQLCLNTYLYDKVLRMRRMDLKHFDIGKISNLMSVDSSTFVALMDYFSSLWSPPLRLTIGAYLLHQTAGNIAFISLGLWFGVMIMMTLLTRVTRRYILGKMEITDRRVKLINEILSGIKSIKFYAWEECLMEEIAKIRQEEVNVMKKLEIVETIFAMRTPLGLWLCMVSLFSGRILLQGESFKAEDMFYILSIIEMITIPMTLIVQFVRNYMMTSASAERLEEFLNLKEGENYVKRVDITNAVEIIGGQFSWTNVESDASMMITGVDPALTADNFSLKSINLKVGVGSFTCIIGSVASGKSSLLNAILGEMMMEKGEVKVKEGLAIGVVPQEAWIQTMTLKENILFGKAYDEERYQRVLSACELLDDISILPGGDETEIGEKGINLSGGQKQRVSLARAVYQDSDIYLLDDCLSALDAHVSKKIFDQVLRSDTGLLKDKTRILATNRLDVVKEVDEIVLIENGSVIEIGKPEKLVRADGKISALLPNFTETSITEHNVEVNGKSKLSESVRQVKYGNLIQKESILEGHVGLKVYITMLEKSSKRWLVISLISIPLAAGSSIYSRIMLADWSGSSKASDTWYLITYTILSACEAILSYLIMMGIAFAYITTCRGLHLDLLKGVLYSPILFFETTPIGRILNRFSKDINSIDMGLRDFLRFFSFTVAFTGAGIIGSFVVEPRMGFVIGPIIVISFYVLKFYMPANRRLKRLESVAKSPIYSHFRETVLGLDLVRTFQVATRFREEFNDKSNLHANSEYLMSLITNWRAMIMGFLSSSVFLFIAICGVLGKGRISGEHIGLLLSFAVRILVMMEYFLKQLSLTVEQVIAVERVLEYADLPNEGERFKLPFDSCDQWPLSGRVELGKYSARYRHGLDLVLKGLTASIGPGEKIGVVGRTGAGKSSVTLSLFRMIERIEGNIVIDQQDIEDIGLFHLRSRLSIIPQDTVIFSGTVRFNLDPFSKHSDEDIWRALEMTHLKHHFEKYGGGLEYVLEEGGKNLSAGQKQLICLARSILKKSKILVLDEATGSIDMETDSLVQETLREEFSDSTMLIIAHRLNTIIDCDRIMVLDQGRIIEFDSPDNLLRDESSKFYSLAQDAGIILNDLHMDEPQDTTKS